MKANNISSKPTSSYLSNSSSSGNSQPFYQSFGTTPGQSQMTNNNNLTTPTNQNASIDSTTSYRQQMPIPNYIPNQKMTVNPSSKISYAGQTVPITSQTKTTNFIPTTNYSAHQNIQNTNIQNSQNIQNPQNIPSYYNHQNQQSLQTAQNVQNFGQWRKN